MIKIITVCKQGLVRSVGLADVLKLHFEPVDVIPIGCKSNSLETQNMLFEWADKIIVMEGKYKERIEERHHPKVLVCEVGPDVYGNSHSRPLIDFCWEWCRRNIGVLGITEHVESL